MLALSGFLALSRLVISPVVPVGAGWLMLPGLAALPAVAQGHLTAQAPVRASDPPANLISHPLVTRDFDQIRAFGVLRMITRASSPGYFIHKGGDAGFEYELLRDFARSWNLRLRVVVAGPGDDLISLLNAGQGDVVAADLELDSGQARRASFTRPCNLVQDALILRQDDSRPGTLAALDDLTVHVPAGSAAWRTVAALRDELGYRCELVASDPAEPVEALIARVARGEIQATVAPRKLAQAVLLETSGARVGAILNEERPVAWLVRQNSSDLLSALDLFLKEHFRVTESGPRRSSVCGALYERYYGDPHQVRGFLAAENRPDIGGRLSRWDELFKSAADSVGIDWRLVAAVAYAESSFDPNAVSPTGAVGLMQVRPRPAGLDSTRLRDPAFNISAGVHMLGKTWRHFAQLDSLDRWRLTLASYHAGSGNLTLARRRARQAGFDPDSWENGVKRGLLLLTLESRADTERLPFHGTVTIDYVRDVLNRYQLYRSVAPARGDPAWRPPAAAYSAPPAGAPSPLRPCPSASSSSSKA